jgi:hypothetical protein
MMVDQPCSAALSVIAGLLDAGLIIRTSASA